MKCCREWPRRSLLSSAMSSVRRMSSLRMNRGKSFRPPGVMDLVCACTPISFRFQAVRNWRRSWDQLPQIIWNTRMRGNRRVEVCRSSTGVVTWICLCSGFDSLSGSARNDRGGSGRSSGDRFQSRLFTNTFDANGSFACVDTHEDDAGGSDHSSDN